MSTIQKLPPTQALLSQAPTVVKLEVEDTHCNVAACILLNNEMFLHSNNDGVTLSAIDLAADALVTQLGAEYVTVHKTTDENALDFSWDDFTKELFAFIDDSLDASGAMPVEFEYEEVVFTFEEYQHFINQLRTMRYDASIVDNETRNGTLFPEQYRSAVREMALCLNIEGEVDQGLYLDVGSIILKSSTLKKAVVMDAINTTITTNDGITLFYVKLDSVWQDVADVLSEDINTLESQGYHISCDPLTVMQAEDATVTAFVSQAHDNNNSDDNSDILASMQSFTLRYFDPVMDNEKNEVSVTIEE